MDWSLNLGPVNIWCEFEEDLLKPNGRREHKDNILGYLKWNHRAHKMDWYLDGGPINIEWEYCKVFQVRNILHCWRTKSMSSGFNNWIPLRPEMTQSRQWARSPWRSSEVLFVRLLLISQYKSQKGTLSLNWTLSLSSLLGKTGLWRSCQRSTRSPRSPNTRLKMSNNLRHSYAPLHNLSGGSLPLPSSEALMVHWGSETLRVLGVS